MNIYIGEPDFQSTLPSDIIIQWVLRSDLAPIPRTVEFIVTNKNGVDEIFFEGARFATGYENFVYRVLKVVKGNPTAYIQDDSPMQTFTVYAVLDSVAGVCMVRDKAVIAQTTTLGQMYRACGSDSRLNIDNDIEIDSFCCFVGGTPTYEIAKALQETSTQIVIKGNRLVTMKLSDMLKQEPIDVIGQFDTTGNIDSEFLERHEVPSFFSIDENGEYVGGNLDKTRQVSFIPRKSENVLNDMSRVLIVRKIIDSDYAANVNAGMVIRVMERNYLIITAAHYDYAVDGIKQMQSRFWVGDLMK